MAFWNRNKNRGREPTADKPNTSEQYKMVITWGEHYYSWNGKLYDSDIIRAFMDKDKLVGEIREDINIKNEMAATRHTRGRLR